MSLSLISYFICSKASNQSDLMQHNVPAAFFHLAQYSVCSSRRRCRRACVRACVRACGVFFTPAVSPSHCTLSPHTTICVTHGYTVCVRCVFHVSVIRFSGEKRSVCCFGALICNCSARQRQFHSR